MSDCLQHGDACPYKGQNVCGEMCNEIRLAMWDADEDFKKRGGGTLHYVRESLIHALEKRGLRVVKVADLNA